MSYHTLKFLHILGFVLMGAGLAGALAADLNLRREPEKAQDACRYLSFFYNLALLPGAVLAGFSGVYLTVEIGFGFFRSPWITGMWSLFAIETMIDNTANRVRLRRLKVAASSGSLSGVVQILSSLPYAFAFYLSIPLYISTLFLGSTRAQEWQTAVFLSAGSVVAGAALAFVAARR